jgi:hypothetical protein
MGQTADSYLGPRFCSGLWTTLALEHGPRFILLWNKNDPLIGLDGRKHEVWKISPGKHSWEYRMIWDARRRCLRKTGVIALPAHLSEDDRPFSLVISPPGDRRKPWYLIFKNFSSDRISFVFPPATNGPSSITMVRRAEI